jgi:general secretion pathway protein D
MRATTFSTVATLVLATGIGSFWAASSAAPDIARIAAQEVVKGDGKKTAAAEPSNVPGEATLEQKLDQRIDIDFLEVPLRDAISYIQENTGIQFVIRQKQLEGASISPDTAITKKLKRVRISTMLELLLDDLELTYVDRDGLVLITTPEDAESRLQTRVYDCRDLLKMEAPAGADKFLPQKNAPLKFPPAGTVGGMFAVEYQIQTPVAADTQSLAPKAERPPSVDRRMAAPTAFQRGGMGGMVGVASLPVSEHDVRSIRLVDVVTSAVKPDSWDDVGGPGSISEYNGLIVVSQTTEVHKQVERLFDMLREAAGLEVPKTGKVVR